MESRRETSLREPVSKTEILIRSPSDTKQTGYPVRRLQTHILMILFCDEEFTHDIVLLIGLTAECKQLSF
jgi:hypothetical protein